MSFTHTEITTQDKSRWMNMGMQQEQQQEHMNPLSIPSLYSFAHLSTKNKQTLEVKPVVEPPALALRRSSQGGAVVLQSRR